MKSEKYNLNQKDMLKVGKGLLLAMTGAGLTYIEQVIPNIQFNEWTPVIVALNSVVANLIRKYLTGL